MSSPRFEAFLSVIYTDATARTRFLANPDAEARRFGLTEAERQALQTIDLTGLELAAESFDRKQAWKTAHATTRPFWRRWL
jgi:hypothetical protein